MTAYRAQIFHCVNDSYQYFEDGVLLIEDGKVKALDHAAKILPGISENIEIKHYPNALITPGFIDTHIHSAQIDVIASYGEQLLEWLDTYTFPAEAKFADAEYAEKTTEIFLQECFRNGTTSAMVMPTVHANSVNALFNAASKYNMRVIGGKVLMDRNAPEYLLDTPESAYKESKQLIEKWHNKNRFAYAVSPRFAPTSSEAQLELAGKLLQEYSSRSQT